MELKPKKLEVRTLDLTQLEYIGKGAFSTVYKLDDKKAIKVMEDEPGWVKDEISIMRGLLTSGRHENILYINDSFILERESKIENEIENEKIINYVFEYDLMGPDLYYYMKSNGPFDIRSSNNIMIQIMNGLKHIHDSGIIHTDLKPENILLSLDSQSQSQSQFYKIKICDFGAARYKKNIANRLMQVRYYRAPEIILRSKTYDHTIDIWSAGCIYYQLLTRDTLFDPIEITTRQTKKIDHMIRIIELLGPIPQKQMELYKLHRNYSKVFNDMFLYYQNVKKFDYWPISDLMRLKFNICDEQIYNIILKCCNYDPAERDNQSIVNMLNNYVY